jgi:single-stranded DNA-binding protein
MNKCYFLGRLKERPRLQKINDTNVIRFNLEVEEFRKDKSGTRKKRKDVLTFEAWDTAATAINKQALPYDNMVVECVARNDRPSDDIVFRVTSFRIFKTFEDEK